MFITTNKLNLLQGGASLLQIFTVLFIFYEVIKMTFADSFINSLKRMKEIGTNKESSLSEMMDIRYLIMMFIEIAYVIYVVTLLFTGQWYIGLAIVALSFIFKNRETKKMIFIDSILSIVILSLILIL